MCSVTLVCSDCECIGITTSLSGVYEITVNGQLTSVYCEMKYGFQWTVILFFLKIICSYTEKNFMYSYIISEIHCILHISKRCMLLLKQINNNLNFLTVKFHYGIINQTLFS